MKKLLALFFAFVAALYAPPQVQASSAFDITLRPSYGNTYVACASFTPASSPTDVAVLIGSSTKTVTLLKVYMTVTTTTVNYVYTGAPSFVIKRSTLDTGGTSSSATIVPLTANAPTATAAVSTYTANPTVGTSVGTVAQCTQVFNGNAGSATAGSAQYMPVPLFDADKYGCGLQLTSATQCAVLNMDGASATSAGGSVLLLVTFVWRED